MTKSHDAADNIDLSDIPELDDAWFRTAHLRRPGDRPQRPMRIDADLVEYFRQRTGDDEDAINAVLRAYVERAEEKSGA
jgi:uncharacterized protein (DUF4415 family)